MLTTTEPPGWQKFIGFIPGNTAGVVALGSIVLEVVLILITLGIAFSGADIEQRYSVGGILFFILTIGPVIVGILIIFSRSRARGVQLRDGEYWTKWIYRTEAQFGDLDGGKTHEVYIGPKGVYNSNRFIKFREFLGGIKSVEIMAGQPLKLRIEPNHIYQKKTGSIEPKPEIILIPNGYLNDAKQLVERLQKEGLNQTPMLLFDQWVGMFIIGGVVILSSIIGMLILMPLYSAQQAEESANQYATVQAIQATESAIIALDFPRIQQVILDHTEALRPQGEGRLLPAEVGFGADDNVDAVEFGYCATSEDFYVLVILQTPLIDKVLGDIGAYLYTSADNPYACTGVWEIVSLDSIESDWYYVALSSNWATLVPYLTENADFINGMLTGTPAAKQTLEASK